MDLCTAAARLCLVRHLGKGNASLLLFTFFCLLAYVYFVRYVLDPILCYYEFIPERYWGTATSDIPITDLLQTHEIKVIQYTIQFTTN